MRIYISADIEGVSGVVSAEQCDQKSGEWQRARKLLTGEVNAAIAGAFAGGATEVFVNDAHGGKKNILIEALDPRARLGTGDPKPLSMMAGLDETYDAVILVGYHSRAASTGVLNHTVSGRVRKLVVNGREVGEVGMNTGIAGYFGVPVIMVAGDDVLEREVKEFFGGKIEFAQVKIACAGRFAANCLTPARSQELISATAKHAVERVKDFKPYDAGKPVTFQTTWMLSSNADAAMMLPGVERVDDTTVRFTHPDHVVAYHCFRTMIALAG